MVNTNAGRETAIALSPSPRPLHFPPPLALICACNRPAATRSPKSFSRPCALAFCSRCWFSPRFPQVILGLETFVARDYGFFAYPLAHFQRECFWRGEMPFWNPYNNCGVPFLAQWNTMPLYPPALIYLTLPLTWSLSFFSLLHLWWAGFGMYFLARRWTENDFAAAFAGTCFCLQRLHAQSADVAQPHRHVQLDAVGRAGRRSSRGAKADEKLFSPRSPARCKCSPAGRKSFF